MADDILYDSILSAVGHTPMVRLKRVARDSPCEVVAKCEFMNPGGSVKDRIGVHMLLEAERAGRIKPGDTLIEPTSGNTGIGIALAASVRGYRVIITMPEKMSQEKQVVLEALGAEIIRTPTEAAFDSPESHIGVARRLHELIPNSHILDQYANPDNPGAHESFTAQEILAQCDGKIDAVVMTAGTGGTITGVARGLKRALPDVKIIGVDPEGSILAGPGEIRSYKVEGIGYDFIPDVLERGLVDRWIKSNDRDSFRMARRLIRQEGLLVGGSSGAAVWAALQVASTMQAGQRVVVVLPDSIRNYLSKFVSDGWMRQHGFAESDWDLGTMGEVLRMLGPQQLVTLDVREPLSRATDLFKKHGYSQLPIVDDGRLVGILTELDVMRELVSGRIALDVTVAEAMVRKVVTVHLSQPANELMSIFERGEVGLVVDDQQHLQGIITKLDLIELVARRSRAGLRPSA